MNGCRLPMQNYVRGFFNNELLYKRFNIFMNDKKNPPVFGTEDFEEMVQKLVKYWESLGKMEEQCLVGQPFYTSCSDCIPGSFPVRLQSSIGPNEFIFPMFNMSLETQVQMCKERNEIARQREIRTEKLAEQKRQKLLASQTGDGCPVSESEADQKGRFHPRKTFYIGDFDSFMV